MKKLLFTTAASVCFMALSFAQIAPSAVTESTKADMAQEEKKSIKEKQENDMNETLAKLGLTEDQIKAAKQILHDSGQKSKELKKNEQLSAEEKDTAKKAINDEKNTKLKQLMGEEKYKMYSEIRKKQKGEMRDAKAPQ